MRNLAVAGSFQAWADNVAEGQRLLLCLQKLAGRWRLLCLYIPFNTWLRKVHENHRLALCAARVFLRWERLSVSVPFFTWVSHAAEGKVLRNVLARVVARWVNQCMAFAFGVWLESVELSKLQEQADLDKGRQELESEMERRIAELELENKRLKLDTASMLQEKERKEREIADQITCKNAELVAASRWTDELQANLNESKARADELNQNIVNMNSKISLMIQDRARAERENDEKMALTASELDQAHRKMASMSSELDRGGNQIDCLSAELDQALRKIGSMASELDEAQHFSRGIEATLQDAKEQNALMEQEIDDMRRKHALSAEEHNAHRNECSQQIESLSAALKQQNMLRSDLQRDLDIIRDNSQRRLEKTAIAMGARLVLGYSFAEWCINAEHWRADRTHKELEASFAERNKMRKKLQESCTQLRSAANDLFSASQYHSKVDTHGKANQGLVGIGLRITDAPPHRVVELVDGGPAASSGRIEIGDLILKVAGVDVRHKPIKEIRRRMLGPSGSTLSLSVERKTPRGQSQIFDMDFVRGNQDEKSPGPDAFVGFEVTKAPPHTVLAVDDLRWLPYLAIFIRLG